LAKRENPATKDVVAEKGGRWAGGKVS